MSSYRMSDIGSEDHPETGAKQRSGGMQIKPGTALVLILLAIAIAVGAGLIVHFVENRKLECIYPDVQATGSGSGQNQQGGKGSSTVSPHTEPAQSTMAPTNQNVRLPSSFIPSLYEIEIKPEMYGEDPSAFFFTGSVKITLQCQDPSTTVTMHSNMLQISNVVFSAANEGASSPIFDSFSEDKERQFLNIELDREAEKGGNYVLQIDFRGALKDDLKGFYLSTYTENGVIKYMGTTQFEPTDARKAFPCFDEPALKAHFKMTIVRKSDLKSLSNMNRLAQAQRGDNFVADVYNTSVKMSTYLVAFVVGDIGNIEKTTSNGIKYGAWSRPQSVDQTQTALDIGVKTITNYENYFQIDFPLPKQDMIAIPDFASGAMENWGLITYRDTAMLFVPGVSSEINLQRVATVITHELSHQWFGDLVTMSWWDDLWLNEGFASYVEYVGADMIFPEWKMFEQFSALEIHDVFDFDALVTSHPVYVPVNNPDEINEIFDKISYSKGASIIRMMKFFLGEDTFKRGLTRYLTNRKFKNAVHDDLWSAMSEQSNTDGSDVNVKEIMDTWTLQMNYPVVMVTRHSGMIRIEQSRFLSNPNATDPMKYTSDFGYKWQIPFTVTTSSTLNFNVTKDDIFWLKDSQRDLSMQAIGLGSSSNDWLLGNVQQMGYYRVNYDTENWKALIHQLKTDHTKIHPINRGQIINDAWSLARGGYLDMSIALEVLEYLENEMDYVPWLAAFRQIGYVDTMLGRTEMYGDFQTFILSKLEKPFKHFGLDDTNSSHIDSLARGRISASACSYGLPTCVVEAKKQFSNWMSDPDNNPIDPDLRYTVYCTAIREGGRTEWDFAWKQFKTADVKSEKSTISQALACSSSPWLLSRYLELAIQPTEIRKQDSTNIMLEIATNPIGASLTWDFIRNRWEYLMNVYGNGIFSFTKLIAGVTSSFNTALQLSELNDFLVKYPNMGTGTRAFKQAIEKTETNIKFLKTNTPVITEWLRNVTTTTEESELKNLRLPRHLIPNHYDVRLWPDMYTGNPDNFTFSGHVTIFLQAAARGRNVTLHIHNLNITESSIVFRRTGNLHSLYAGTRREDKKRMFLVLDLNTDVIPGQGYQLDLNFTSHLTSDLSGLYLSSYERDNQTIYMVTTQMEATDGRKAFPCFDEPNMKATFSVTLIRKSYLTAISNMPKITDETLADDFVADHFNTTPVMSTYLLAFIICDFEFTTNTSQGGVMYRAWARPESVNQTLLALNAGTQLMDFYEDYFGIKFPLPKQDMIAIPDFAAGAMENWGLITYRETAMLFEPGVSSESDKQWVTVVVAHELGHQWFGDLVTMKWWDDIWLNEGFATFIEYLGTDQVYPDMKMFDQFVLDIHDVFSIDSLVTSHPVFVPVETPDEIDEIFDTISYQKGGSIIRMMRFFLGEATFKHGLQKYLQNNKYSNAGHSDLWEALQTQADADGLNVNISHVLDTWLLQMNYPVVMVTKNSNGTITIEQKRHLADPEAKDPGKYSSPFGYVWSIPFTFTQKSSANFDVNKTHVTWLEGKETTIQGANTGSMEWIIGNIRQYGVYRVNYAESNWKLLIDQLKKDHTVIHLTNRAQIIDDAFGLAVSGDLSMDVALSSLDYLDRETEYVPWSSANGQLSHIRHMVQGEPLYGKFKAFMRSKRSTLFKELGFRDNITDHLQSYMQSQTASSACYYGDPDCIKEANALFDTFMTSGSNPIAPSLRSTVYCTAVRTGNQDVWEFVYQKFKAERVATEKNRLRDSLACTTEPYLLTRVLEIALEMKDVRKQDVYKVFQSVSSESQVGQILEWNFIISRWETLFDMIGKEFSMLRRIISGVTASFNTEYQLNELLDFKANHPGMGTGARALDQAVERTRSNIKWMSRFHGNIESWLLTNE